ncbi:hypothetical protein NCPPB3923_00995 [Burkholderia glumae]|nr:hypothetical protein NCPPB3923_00995 [Burkholderia glumae]
MPRPPVRRAPGLASHPARAVQPASHGRCVARCAACFAAWRHAQPRPAAPRSRHAAGLNPLQPRNAR